MTETGIYGEWLNELTSIGNFGKEEKTPIVEFENLKLQNFYGTFHMIFYLIIASIISLIIEKYFLKIKYYFLKFK